MGDGDTDNDKLLHQYWQTGRFIIEDEGVSNREKLIKLRQLMFFIHQYLVSGKIDGLTYAMLHKQLSNEYSTIVGTTGQQKEPNNCLDVPTSRLSVTQNTSLWSSSLYSGDSMPDCISRILSQKKVCRPTLRIKLTNDLIINNKNAESNTQIVPPKDNQTSNSMVQTKLKKAPMFHGKRKFQDFQKPPNHYNANDIGESQSSTSHTNNYRNNKAVHLEQKLEVNPSNEKKRNPFLTAGEQLSINDKKKNHRSSLDVKDSSNSISSNYGTSSKKSLGTRRGVNGRFVPPVGQDRNESDSRKVYGDTSSTSNKNETDAKYEKFEWMKNIESKMIELIENEIMDHGTQVSWDDIAGLEFAKNTIQEIVIWPMLRPDIFTGLRGPPKGILLFGPPGTGKTLIGKCIASQSNATFFSISASSLTSKWVGEGEKMVRALFAVARCHQPAVIFIDEIDSLLTQRSDTEHESSRRIKTEFLVQLDGATCVSDERILVVGATNRPQELDEAARRRLVKRLYIPLPEDKARKQIVTKLMSQQANDLLDNEIDTITMKADGYSGADMANLCREAALGPIRSIRDIRNINANEVRPVCFKDFENALDHVRPSVSKNDLIAYVEWNNLYGSGMSR